MSVKKKKQLKSRVSSKAKKLSKKFQFKPWLGLLLVLIIAVVGLVVFRFSQAAPAGGEDRKRTLNDRSAIGITGTHNVSSVAGSNGYQYLRADGTKVLASSDKTAFFDAVMLPSGSNNWTSTNNRQVKTFCVYGQTDLPRGTRAVVRLTAYGTGNNREYTKEQEITTKSFQVCVDGISNYGVHRAKVLAFLYSKDSYVSFDGFKETIKPKYILSYYFPDKGSAAFYTNEVLGSQDSVRRSPSYAPDINVWGSDPSYPERPYGLGTSYYIYVKCDDGDKLLLPLGIESNLSLAKCYTGELPSTSQAKPISTDNPITPPPPPAPTTGSVDAVRSDAGSCAIGGWAKDQSAPDKFVKVDLYVDKPAGQAGATYQVGGIVADDARSDAVGNHGYNILLPEKVRDGKPHTAYVYAHETEDNTPVLLNGSPKSFTCTPPDPIDGVVDGVANLDTCQVSGWAYDTSNKAASIGVAVNVLDANKKLLKQIDGKADRDSKDVNDVEGITGKHRYVVQIPDEFRNGNSYYVSVHGKDSDSKGGNGLLKNSPRGFKCNDTKKGTTGSLAGVSKGETCYFKGWAIDKDKPTAKVPLRLVLNGFDDDPKADEVIAAVADKVTDDSSVVSGVPVGQHKFEIPVPSQYNTGNNYNFALYSVSSTGREDLNSKFASGTFRCETPNVVQDILASVGLASQNYQITVKPEQNHLYWAVYDRGLSSANTSFTCNNWNWLQQIFGAAFCEVSQEKVLELKSPILTAEFDGKASMCIRAISENDLPLTVSFVATGGSTITKTATYTSAPDTIIFGQKTVACVDNNRPFEIGSIDKIIISAPDNDKAKIYAARLKPVE